MANLPAAAAAGGEGGEELPPFESIDFTDLHEFIETARAGEDGSNEADPVAVALKRGVQETNRVAADIDGQLEMLEGESVADYVASYQAFEDLHEEIVATDAVLEKMERMLGTYQYDLSSISDEIRILQGDSLQMNMKLRNRRALQKLMNEYVSSVVVSPQLIRCICEEEINEEYLGHLTELNKKLDHVTQIDMQNLPSCAQSTPELERLRTKAVARIKEFLLQKINALKKPKTNLQIIQRNVLVRYKLFTQFLAEHHAAVADEVKLHYVTTMSAVYLKQFRTYVSCLQKLELENGPTRADTLVGDQWQTAASNPMNLLTQFGLGGKEAKMKEKGSVFSLAGRDTILAELEKDPIIAHSTQNKVKYYHEQLFRSHQMLLMDTATSEFLFLTDFFETKGDPMLFHEVFSKTTQFFLDSLETFLAGCWDSVGLLLMIRIVEFYRKSMQRRHVSCLDKYLEDLQQQLWPRLECVLKENTASLRKAAQQGLTVPTNNFHGHLVTRRYAELAASLHWLSTGEPSLAEIEKPLQSMQVEARNLLETMASKIEGPETNALVFLVNNYDLVLTIFHERQLQRSTKAGFEELLSEQSHKFVESQLKLHFPDLVSFVTATEPLVQGLDENSARASEKYQGPPASVDVPRMDQVVRSFARSWKQETDSIHKNVMTSFQNFSNGMDILKQVLMQLLLYYERLYSIINKCFPQQQAPFQTELVTKYTILMEIKRFSRSF